MDFLVCERSEIADEAKRRAPNAPSPRGGWFRIAATALAATAVTVGVVAANEKSDPVAIDLGGLREVKAVLSVSDGDYLINVRMRRVRCFDDATNARLNREKVRESALQALARRLSPKPYVELSVSGAKVENSGPDGKFYALTLRVPREGVALVRAENEPTAVAKPAAKAGVDRVLFASDFFTRKRDYIVTVERMTRLLIADLHAAEKAGKGLPTNDAFFLAIADLEERGSKNFEGIGREVKSDRLLLDIEKSEVNDALSKQQQTLLEALKEAVKRREASDPKEKVP